MPEVPLADQRVDGHCPSERGERGPSKPICRSYCTGDKRSCTQHEDGGMPPSSWTVAIAAAISTCTDQLGDCITLLLLPWNKGFALLCSFTFC
ncbi:hypothetical protein L914_12817 [Phytophthora nicotianae]|uniref:Uncharacterized protein n=2 Tax=Phytophthora nicotianae TaxID=4792 RepID=W2MYG9_PHYNI|nr:hypothetical protein L914_12817 [Phytophthora nicotianae]ETO70103.1 hypothetical protein F444_13397 [Phytophthora nicotianae P1976]